FGTPELKGTPGSVPLVVTVTALGKPTFFTAREGIAYYSDALAYYPEKRRSADAYIRRVDLANRKDGFVGLGPIFEAKIGDTTFSREDFKKAGLVTPTYESVIVKACESQALVFIFAGPDLDAINKLISSTQVKLDPKTSGCVASRGKIRSGFIEKHHRGCHG